MERKKIIEGIKKTVNTTDGDDSKTRLPLIKKPKGTITYEHSFADKLFCDVYIGASERNYYVDKYHELCLCVYYNRRISGKYEFDGEYYFYVTKKRQCTDIYGHLGHISDTGMVIEYYDSISAAKESFYYDDFVELMGITNNAVELKKSYENEPLYDMASVGELSNAGAEDSKYLVFETGISEKREVLQFYYDMETKEWVKWSVSSETLMDKTGFLKDFEELDKDVFHTRTFHSINEQVLIEDQYYKKAFEFVKTIREIEEEQAEEIEEDIREEEKDTLRQAGYDL